MSVLKVKKVNLVGLAKDADQIMQALHHASVMHIERDDSATAWALTDNSTEAYAHKLEQLAQALQFLRRFLATKNAIPPKALSAENLLAKVTTLQQGCATVDARIADIKQLLATYSPFGDFVENSDALTRQGMTIRLARLSDAQLATQMGHLHHHVVARVGVINLVAIITTNRDELGVETMPMPTASMPTLRNELVSLESRSVKIKEEAGRWAYQVRILETLEAATLEKLEQRREMGKAKKDGALIGISGYVLARDVDHLKKALLDLTIASRIEEPTRDENIPVMLQNPRALRGFEAIVRAFTGLNYFEKDKTGIVSLLFMVFGAMCLLDAGYGFLLLLSGYVIAIKNNRDFGQICMWTGASATILGLLSGQVFGLTFAKDILFNIPPVLTLATDPMVCFKFSLLVGVAAMGLANMVAIYQNRLLTHATGNLLAVFAVVTLIVRESELLVGRFYDPAHVLSCIAIVLLAMSVLAWVLFPDPVFGKDKHLANAMWMLYAGPLGLVQDIMSHMRLFGIALSGSILALVINKICGLLPFPIGALFAPLGHLAIFLLALLSLYIHTNRLIFLEFGTKCMKGGNTYFKPFARRL